MNLMMWMPDEDDDLQLYLREAEGDWVLFSETSYKLSDPPGFSTGYATFLALLKDGWKVMETVRN